MNDTARPLCVCGHPAVFHEHYRAGDDCGTCGSTVCPTYYALPPARSLLERRSPLPWWRRLLRHLTGPDTAGGTA